MRSTALYQESTALLIIPPGTPGSNYTQCSDAAIPQRTMVVSPAICHLVTLSRAKDFLFHRVAEEWYPSYRLPVTGHPDPAPPPPSRHRTHSQDTAVPPFRPQGVTENVTPDQMDDASSRCLTAWISSDGVRRGVGSTPLEAEFEKRKTPAARFSADQTAFNAAESLLRN